MKDIESTILIAMSNASQAGKVALVTGGSRGIGLAIADAIVERGGSVVITGRDAGQLETASGLLEKDGRSGRVHALRADVRSAAEAAAAVDAARERFGGLDVLVNNAGVGIFANVAEMGVEEWDQVVETNLSGVFYCCHAAIPLLRARGGGWIINISSLAGTNAFASAAAYCASKAGLNAFSEALMQEVRYDNIRVSYIMPGSVATDFGGRSAQAAGLNRPGEDWKIAAADVADVVMDLLATPARTLPSRIELRPSRPKK
jgi:NAD(P)-dependent dehydrogenase (short-subunit alcohol dehydrogenase family)